MLMLLGNRRAHQESFFRSAVLHAKLLIQVFLIKVTVRGEFFNFTSGCRCPLRHGRARTDPFKGDITLLPALLMSTS